LDDALEERRLDVSMDWIPHFDHFHGWGYNQASGMEVDD
jgi:hypothetical protein